MSQLPFNSKNVYRAYFGTVVDGKLVEAEPRAVVLKWEPTAESEVITASMLPTFTLTATFTIKKWQPNPFNPHDMPTLWYLHRKKFTSQN